jgi:hypothetical protein
MPKYFAAAPRNALVSIRPQQGAAHAVDLGTFVLAAHYLFAAGDPPNFGSGYHRISKLYADDLTDNLPEFKVLAS